MTKLSSYERKLLKVLEAIDLEGVYLEDDQIDEKKLHEKLMALGVEQLAKPGCEKCNGGTGITGTIQRTFGPGGGNNISPTSSTQPHFIVCTCLKRGYDTAFQLVRQRRIQPKT